MASLDYAGIRDDLKIMRGLLQKLDESVVRYFGNRQKSMSTCSQQFTEEHGYSDVAVCSDDTGEVEAIAESEIGSNLADDNSCPVANSEACNERFETPIGTSFNSSLQVDSSIFCSLGTVSTLLDFKHGVKKDSQDNASKLFDETPQWGIPSFPSALTHFQPFKSNNLLCQGIIFSTISAYTPYILDVSVKALDFTIVDLSIRFRVIPSHVSAQCMLFHFPFDPGPYTLTTTRGKMLTGRMDVNMMLNFWNLQNKFSSIRYCDGSINFQAILDLINSNHALVSQKLVEGISPQSSCMVARLIICQCVHTFAMDVECSSSVGSSCSISKLLKKSMCTSFLYSGDGAPTHIAEQYIIDRLRHFWSGKALELDKFLLAYVIGVAGHLHTCGSIAQPKHVRHLFVTHNFCWADYVVGALGLISYSRDGNHDNDGSYGVRSSYQISGSYNGGILCIFSIFCTVTGDPQPSGYWGLNKLKRFIMKMLPVHSLRDEFIRSLWDYFVHSLVARKSAFSYALKLFENFIRNEPSCICDTPKSHQWEFFLAWVLCVLCYWTENNKSQDYFLMSFGLSLFTKCPKYVTLCDGVTRGNQIKGWILTIFFCKKATPSLLMLLFKNLADKVLIEDGSIVVNQPISYLIAGLVVNPNGEFGPGVKEMTNQMINEPNYPLQRFTWDPGPFGYWLKE